MNKKGRWALLSFLLACIILLGLYHSEGYRDKIDRLSTCINGVADLAKKSSQKDQNESSLRTNADRALNNESLVANAEVMVEDKNQQSLQGDQEDMVFMRKFGRVKNLPSADQIKEMSDKEVNYILHSYLDNTDFHCERKIRLGTASDGGYETCDDYSYRPLHPCIVYSFGIRNEFSFDDDVAKLYKCNVSSFDPSMKQKTHQRSDRIWFYKIGIGGNEHQTSKGMSKNQQGWVVKTLTEIKAMLHHQNKTIDLLKMDIESSEWPAMENALASGELRQVRQLLIEFHLDSSQTLRHRLAILHTLEALGFRRFRTHVFAGGGLAARAIKNPAVFPVDRRCCYEMGFVNINLARH